MIRRYGIALLFAVLGVVSLLVVGLVDARLCDLFPALQLCRSGGCGLDCSQSWSLAEQIRAFLFYFGPSIVFASAAYIFSKRPHRTSAWTAFVASLVAVHSVVVIVVMNVATK